MSIQLFRYFLLLTLALGAVVAHPPSVDAAAPAAAASDAARPYSMQRAADGVAHTTLGPLQRFTPALQLATAAVPHSGPHREIFGFALASSLSDPTVGYPSWNFSLLSTVAFFGLHVRTDGYFSPDSGATVWGSSQLTDLINAAH